MNSNTNAPNEIDTSTFHDADYFHDMESFYCKEFEVSCGACKTVTKGTQDTLERSGWKFSRAHEMCPKCITYLYAVQTKSVNYADK